MNFKSGLLALTLVTFSIPVFAATSPIVVQELHGTIGGAGVTTVSTVGAAIGTGHAVIGTLVYDNAGTFTNVQVGGVTATIAATLNGTTPTPLRHMKTFYLLNVTGNPTTVTANFSVAVDYPQITWQEVYPLASFDVQSSREVLNVSTAANSITTANATTAQADYIYGVTMEEPGNTLTNPPTAGSGFIQGIRDATGSNWTLSTENLIQSAASSTTQAIFSYGDASDNWLVGMMAFKPAPFPVGMTGTCASPAAIADSLNPPPQTICGFTVTTSDASTYTGTNSVTPNGLFAVSAGTGNANLVTNKTLLSSDDGTTTATLKFVENGVSLSVPEQVNITAASVAGTPLAMGWKGIDPSGQVIFTEPTSAKTVNQLLLRNSVLSSAAAFLHVYRAPPGVACTLTNVANLTSLHNGDFDLFYQVNGDQIIAPINASLAVADSVCVLTKDSSGKALNSSSIGSMQGTLTVTVN